MGAWGLPDGTQATQSTNTREYIHNITRACVSTQSQAHTHRKLPTISTKTANVSETQAAWGATTQRDDDVDDSDRGADERRAVNAMR